MECLSLTASSAFCRLQYGKARSNEMLGISLETKLCCISSNAEKVAVCCIPYHHSTFPNIVSFPDLPQLQFWLLADCKRSKTGSKTGSKTVCLQHAILQVNKTRSRGRCGNEATVRAQDTSPSLLLLSRYLYVTIETVCNSITNNQPVLWCFLHADSSLGYPATLSVCESLAVVRNYHGGHI